MKVTASNTAVLTCCSQPVLSLRQEFSYTITLLLFVGFLDR